MAEPDSGDVERARDSAWTDGAIRFGLVAYGVVHVLLGYLAVQMALGDKSGKLTSTGALKELAEKPFGKPMLVLVAGGFALLVGWRALEIVAPDVHSDEALDKWVARASSAVKLVIYAVLCLSAVRVALGDSPSGSGTDSATAKLMDLPAGQVLIGLIGLGVVAYGGYLIYQGIADKFLDELDGEGRGGDSGTAYRIVGKIGHCAKGLAIGGIGALFVWAAATHEAKKSGGLDQALGRLLDQPFGPVLVALVGVGLACYGLFTFGRARHLSH